MAIVKSKNKQTGITYVYESELIAIRDFKWGNFAPLPAG